MSTKKKLIISLSVLSVTIIVAIASVVGVLALINTDFNFGGSISFTATNIHATVSKASVTGGTLTDETKMQEIFMDAENSGSDDVATWSGVNLNFPESGDDVVIKFTITNHSENDKLKVTIGELTGTYNNATMSVAITGEEEGTTTAVIDPAVPADADAGTDRVEHSKEVVVTFHITNKNKDASITNFNIPIDLARYVGYNVTLHNTIMQAEYNSPFVPDPGADIPRNGIGISVWTDANTTQTQILGEGSYLGFGAKLFIIEDYEDCYLLYTIVDGEGNSINYASNDFSEDGVVEITLTKDIELTITEIAYYLY